MRGTMKRLLSYHTTLGKVFWTGFLTSSVVLLGIYTGVVAFRDLGFWGSLPLVLYGAVTVYSLKKLFETTVALWESEQKILEAKTRLQCYKEWSEALKEAYE